MKKRFNSAFKLTMTSARSSYYSTINSSLVQLSEDIDFIYNHFKTHLQYNLSQEDLMILQQMLLSGLYTISPLRLRRIRRDDLADFLFATLPDFPDLTFYPSKDSSYYIVVFPSKKEDVLLFMALSIHFYRFTYGSVPKERYRLVERVDLFMNCIHKMGKVTKLFRINLDPSLQLIPSSQVLDPVKSFVGADSVSYNLVSQFMDLATIDEEGRHVRFGCMPILGEITKVLFNLALMEFDRQLCNQYPGIQFERFIGLVFIASTDDLIFDEYKGRALIEELGLYCDIESIGPGDEPLDCYHGKVALDNEGKVVVINPID